MEPPIIQSYQFREHSDGIMVGGYGIEHLIDHSQIEGSSRLEGLSVPIGLFTSNRTGMIGGSQIETKVILGGTIGVDVFDKLYNRVTETKASTKRTTAKKKTK